MAHRILIGNRATGGYGLYVSQSGDDVLTTTEPLLFDSRAGNSWTIKKVQEGTIAANGAPQTVTHNLGYYPMVAVRWSHSITNGYATEVYDHVWANEMQEGPTQGNDPDQWEVNWQQGCYWAHTSTNAITVYNKCDEAYLDTSYAAAPPASFLSNSAIYYAVIVFNQAYGSPVSDLNPLFGL
tara:strand:+ start:1676 stop:2221 length:546 start_codon:yes stop_codon:yes gene_type:complete